MAVIGLLKYEEGNPNHLQALKGNEGIQHFSLNEISSSKLSADGRVKVPCNVPLLYRPPWQMPAYPTLPHTRFESEINEPGLPRPRRVFVVAASERTNDLAKAPSLPPFYVPEVEGKGHRSQIFRESAHELHCRSLNKTTATTPSLRIPARAIKETINSFSPRPSKRARRLLGECKKEPPRGQKNVDVMKNVVVLKITRLSRSAKSAS